MGQKLEVKVGSRRLRVQVGNHSERSLVAAADRANEVLERLSAVSKGSSEGGPTSTQLVQALFTISLSYENHRGEARKMIEEAAGDLVSMRRQLEELITISGGPV
mgnify:CR=1 FL=1|jgi:hypothetical protein